MSSNEQITVVRKRKTNKLNLDSEEEARIEAQQQKREEQIRIRKEQKRRRRQEEARRIQQQATRIRQLQKKYESADIMLQQDSNSNDSFGRVEKKIRKKYPDLKRKQEHIYNKKRRQVSQSSQSESEQDESSEQEEESQSKGKKIDKKKRIQKQKKQKKIKNHEDAHNGHRPSTHNPKVKIQEEDPKISLAKEVGIRWWYCVDEWPPKNYNYEQQLKKLGYRCVDQNKFRTQQQVVNGLVKATPIDGYIGVFKSKHKIIDVRQKENCPSMSFFKSKSIDELTKLLRTALTEQILDLKNVKYQQSGDVQLLNNLERQLKSLK